MRYELPIIHKIQINQFLRNQGSDIVPINPNCDDGTECLNTPTFVGTSCFPINNGNDLSYDVHYFIPNLTCLSLNDNTPCTVKVNGNVLSCTQESECDDATCNSQIGSIIQCSGIIPDLGSCSGLQATVECTSETDSDACAEL